MVHTALCCTHLLLLFNTNFESKYILSHPKQPSQTTQTNADPNHTRERGRAKGRRAGVFDGKYEINVPCDLNEFDHGRLRYLAWVREINQQAQEIYSSTRDYHTLGNMHIRFH